MTALSYKPGVATSDLTQISSLIIRVARGVWESLGEKECVVTSLKDGVHMPGSKHYTGEAVDFRTWNLKSQVGVVAQRLRLALGPLFQVIIEHDHIHVELDVEAHLATLEV